MRWFLTADNVLIPERLIGRINLTANGSAIAQVFDQQGRSSTATLSIPFIPLATIIAVREDSTDNEEDDLIQYQQTRGT